MSSAVQATQGGWNQIQANQVANQVGALQDQFMEILLTQLRYQDPMEPVNEQDFFAQMAQFTTATQMQNLNGNISWLCSYLVENQLGRSLVEAAHLIGKQFEAVVSNGLATGVIEGVGFCSGRLVVRSKEQEIPVENLIWIGGAVHGTED
ncbi:MAG TPA: hypothetical protein GX529_04365 [Firmicutes bacterium]|nr:hypothetical protein [Candidatus Fermentithermobacillaceae bacterium]